MKKVFISLAIAVMALGFSIQAEAELQTIGTATYEGADYNLIYDNDINLTWLDYTNYREVWAGQNSWAAGLNTGGVLTYNFNAGVSMSWSDDWRLPILLDEESCNIGYCANSEMTHLYYTGLGNVDWPDEGYDLFNTGDFQNLKSDAFYWLGTDFVVTGDWANSAAWLFYTGGGEITYDELGYNYFAIAVRPGELVVVPEPISSTLFIVGGVVLGLRLVRKKINI